MSYQLELRQLQNFVAVADELHFRRAAEKLFISQPGLSRQIKQMEEVLETKLFDRHNRKVELTPAGHFLAEEIRSLLLSLDQTIVRTKLLGQGTAGTLNFGYLGSAMQDFLPTLLVKIRGQYPDVIFNLKEMDNQSQIDGIIRKTLDFGFVRLDKVPQGISMAPVYQDTFSLVLPSAHHITPSNFQSLHQLKDDSFILFDQAYSHSYYNKVIQLFDKAGFSPTISHRSIHASHDLQFGRE